MGRVTGKVAVVTGAASEEGIGFATAQLLVREGASVVLTDLSAEVEQRSQELGGDTIGVVHDVTDEDSWTELMRTAAARFGAVDILVNNAAITLRAPIQEMEYEVYRTVVTTNLDGTFLGSRAAVRAMAGRGGSIVNLTSINSVVGLRNSSAYGASKGGIRAMTKVIAMEGAAAGIRCNTVCPGMIQTAIHRPVMAATPELHRALVESIPMKRMGEPADIANAILFLASDESRYVTGAELVVDGGFTVQ